MKTKQGEGKGAQKNLSRKSLHEEVRGQAVDSRQLLAEGKPVDRLEETRLEGEAALR